MRIFFSVYIDFLKRNLLGFKYIKFYSFSQLKRKIMIDFFAKNKDFN